MGLHELSSILWQERHLLEVLAFKLEQQALLLGAGRTRWLSHAADELDLVLEELRDVEVLRAITVDVVAAEVGLRAGCTLAELVAATPPPWDELLAQHRAALVALADEVRERSGANCSALARGATAVREVLTAARPPGADGDELEAGLLVDRFA